MLTKEATSFASVSQQSLVHEDFEEFRIKLAVGARKLSKCLGLGSSLRLPSRAPTTRGQARWSPYIDWM
jgi:hypothetical protein